MGASAPPFPATRILLAGSGGIGVSLLPAWVVWMRSHLDLEVRCALTRNACELVSPAALSILCGAPVLREVDREETAAGVPHLEAAAWAEAVLVAPATANVMAKIANGIADDLVTTVVLAATCPVVLVPSLAPAMEAKPALRRALAQLAEDGVGIVPTDDGLVASDGSLGGGAMADPLRTLAYLKRFVAERRVVAA